MEVKLVRDKIPQLAKDKVNAEFVKCNNYFTKQNLLAKKLYEEINEYLDDYNLEELIDIETVIRAIIKHVEQISPEEFEELYKQKAKERGEFDEFYLGIFN